MKMEDMQTFGWDDEISNEGTPFALFDAGTYPFTVVNFERSTYQPKPNYQAKVPTGTNMAILSLEFINASTGEKSTVKENLYLYGKGEWRISQFFISIGQKKKGEPLRPNWQAVLGAKGIAELEINNYTDRDGNPGKNNRVKTFNEPTQQAASPAYQAPQQNYQQTPPPQPQANQQPPVTPFPGATPQQPQTPPTGGYNFGG